MKPELDESLSRFHAAIVGGAKEEEATRAIPPLSGTINAPVEYLDLATVIKVSQAVSGEIVQEKQLEILMRTAIEQAEAERGVLVLSRWTEPRIAAQATTGDGGIVVKLHDEAMTPAVLPESVIQYVVRTNESVILDDAAAQNPFSADPYIRQQHARSILCLPFLNQGQLIGVLYLENNLTPGVFTPARIAVLKLLASQVAISLENARLYRDLAEREAKIRRLVEAQTPRAEDELRAIVDNAPVFLWSDLPDGCCDFLNQPWLTYFNLSLQEAQGAGWATVLHPDDAAHHLESWQKSVSTGIPFETEARFRRSDGEYRWFLTRANPLRDKTGRIVKWYGTNIDIENLKRTEARLRQSEAYLAEAQQLAHIGSLAFNATGFGHWSPELFKIHGLDPGDKAPSIPEYLALVHPEDRDFVMQEIQKMLAGAEGFDFTKRIVWPDGAIRHVRCVGGQATTGGVVPEFVGTGMDVTEQEQLTEELRRSEFYLAEGQRLGHAGSWSFKPDRTCDYWSRELYEILGFDPGAGVPTISDYLTRIHPQDREVVAATIQRMIAAGEGCDLKKRIIRPDGVQRVIRCVGMPVRENGVLTRFVGTLMDITEQEELTQELRRREAYLAEAQRLSHTGSFGWKPDTGEIIWSAETYRIFEYDRAVAPTIDLVAQRVHPEDRADFQSVIERASEGASDFEHAYRLLLPDGRAKHVHALAHATRDASGNREFVGAVTDMTDHKRAEESLRASEAYLAEAQKLSHTGSWAWSPDTDVRYWSEECYRVLGFDPRDGLPRMEELIQRIHPDDQPAFRESAKRSKHKKLDEEVDYRIVHPDGAVRDIHSIGHPVFSPSGDLIEFTGTVIDVTERKRAEEKLRERASLLDLTHDTIFVRDMNDVITYWNRGAAELYGWMSEEAVGQVTHTLLHTVFSEPLEGITAELLATGRWEGELRHTKRDGTQVVIASRWSLLQDDQGNALAMTGDQQRHH